MPCTSSGVVRGGGGGGGGGGGERVERGIAVAESRERGMVLGRGCGAALEIQTGNLSKSV